MKAYRVKHHLLQTLRHACRLAVLLVVVAVVYLSLYAHDRAARAMEDDQFLTGVAGRILRSIDTGVASMADPEAFLDGYKGILWSMRFADVNLTNPLAAAEMTAASRSVHWPLIVSILIPVVVTLALGRVFCSWMCPAGLLFELTDKLRSLLRLAEIKPAAVRFSHGNKYVVLAVGLVIAALTAAPIFALLYPPAVVSRIAHAWVFGTALAGMLTLLGVMIAVEVFVSPRWWCRTMCPGGALYALIGWPRLLRVRLRTAQCTSCGDCAPVCPVGIDPVGESASIECDNCGVCIGHCPTRALYYTIGLPGSRRSAKGERDAPGSAPGKRVVVSAIVVMAVLLTPARAAAHHILGLPHYSYKENYPQAPTLEYPATTGPYDVLMTSYPGKPAPAEPANIAFYIKDRENDEPYDRPVKVRVLQTFTFGRNREIVAPASVEPFDALHKLSVTFPEDGEYVVELTMHVEGQDEVIPFLIVAGRPSATKSILIAIGAGVVVFVVVVRAIRIKRDRRKREGAAPPGQPETDGTAAA